MGAEKGHTFTFACHVTQHEAGSSAGDWYFGGCILRGVKLSAQQTQHVAALLAQVADVVADAAASQELVPEDGEIQLGDAPHAG